MLSKLSGLDPCLPSASSAVVLGNPLSMHTHIWNSEQTWDNVYPTKESPNNNNGGSPFSDSVVSEAIAVIQIEDQNDPNLAERDKKIKPDKFWGKMNTFVLTLASGGALGIVLSKVALPPSSSSPGTFRVIAVSDGVAFMSSFIGLAVGDKKPNLVKAFASVGAVAGVFMVNVALAEFCYSEHAILVGAIASIPPLITLIKRVFNFTAYVPTLLPRGHLGWPSLTSISYGS